MNIDLFTNELLKLMYACAGCGIAFGVAATLGIQWLIHSIKGE